MPSVPLVQQCGGKPAHICTCVILRRGQASIPSHCHQGLQSTFPGVLRNFASRAHGPLLLEFEGTRQESHKTTHPGVLRHLPCWPPIYPSWGLKELARRASKLPALGLHGTSQEGPRSTLPGLPKGLARRASSQRAEHARIGCTSLLWALTWVSGKHTGLWDTHGPPFPSLRGGLLLTRASGIHTGPLSPP